MGSFRRSLAKLPKFLLLFFLLPRVANLLKKNPPFLFSRQKSPIADVWRKLHGSALEKEIESGRKKVYEKVNRTE